MARMEAATVSKCPSGRRENLLMTEECDRVRKKDEKVNIDEYSTKVSGASAIFTNEISLLCSLLGLADKRKQQPMRSRLMFVYPTRSTFCRGDAWTSGSGRGGDDELGMDGKM